jgi:hypothetical protein
MISLSKISVVSASSSMACSNAPCASKTLVPCTKHPCDRMSCSRITPSCQVRVMKKTSFRNPSPLTVMKVWKKKALCWPHSLRLRMPWYSRKMSSFFRLTMNLLGVIGFTPSLTK